jgi:hypothetical protein
VNQPLLQMDLRLLGLAIVVLGAAVSIIWWVGRKIRGDLGLPVAKGADDPSASLPPQVSRMLQQRGLATPAQLANMSALERQLLFSTMASAIEKEAEPETSSRPSARAYIRPEELPTLYCPTCSYRIERFTSTLPITGQCETCHAKVVVRRDGGRILLTVLPKDETEARRPDLRLEP